MLVADALSAGSWEATVGVSLIRLSEQQRACTCLHVVARATTGSSMVVRVANTSPTRQGSVSGGGMMGASGNPTLRLSTQVARLEHFRLDSLTTHHTPHTTHKFACWKSLPIRPMRAVQAGPPNTPPLTPDEPGGS